MFVCDLAELQNRLQTYESNERKWEEEKNSLSEELNDFKTKLKSTWTKLEEKEMEAKFQTKRYDLQLEQLEK